MMHMILTDYRQRSRQFSFRLLAVFALFSAVLLAPRQTGSFRVLVLDPHYFAQANNPTWAPVGVVAVLTFFFPFIGLVLARQGMSQDRESGILSAFLPDRLKNPVCRRRVSDKLPFAANDLGFRDDGHISYDGHSIPWSRPSHKSIYRDFCHTHSRCRVDQCLGCDQ
ncbi:hypothetical protein [Lacticaseibacillus rhamnosus]|uniref:hypothetical protein n=1 Tax=Lacticaseibacillus rhamnosus TaxID=47715 RepID=UPI003863B3FB